MMRVLVAVERNLSSVTDVHKPPKRDVFQDTADYYWENGFCVFTESYLVKKEACCGSGCRHCPYLPKHIKGSVKIRQEVLKNL